MSWYLFIYRHPPNTSHAEVLEYDKLPESDWPGWENWEAVGPFSDYTEGSIELGRRGLTREWEKQ
jgi:hypothetical protein